MSFRHTFTLLLTLVLPSAGLAQIDVSSDISETFKIVPSTDEDVLHDDGSGGLFAYSQVSLGTLPDQVDVIGFERSGSDVLFSLDSAVDLGGTIFESRDVIRYDGAVYTLAFNGSAQGVPSGARVDAVGLDPSGNLLLSFDIAVDLPGLAGIADEEVVSFDGASFASVFNGAALGSIVAGHLDVDGVAQFANGVLRLSFNNSGRLGGVDFDDEDALDYDAGSGTWTLAYDASSRDPDWAQADLVALPEPGVLFSLIPGALGLGALARIRRNRTQTGGLS